MRPCGAAQPEELNLLEDGLQLWLVALRNAPAPEPGLLQLFPHLVAIMERSTGAHVHRGGVYAVCLVDMAALDRGALAAAAV